MSCIVWIMMTTINEERGSSEVEPKGVAHCLAEGVCLRLNRVSLDVITPILSMDAQKPANWVQQKTSMNPMFVLVFRWVLEA